MGRGAADEITIFDDEIVRSSIDDLGSELAGNEPSNSAVRWDDDDPAEDEEDDIGEACVFCGVRQPAAEFEDGLRCRSCAAEDDDPDEEEEQGICANCGAEMDFNPAHPWCEDCDQDDEEDDS